MVTEEKILELADYEATFVDLQQGKIVKGTVVKIDPTEILVDVGGKSEGVIPLRELTNSNASTTSGLIEIGEEIELYILKEENEDGQVTLSKRRVDQARGWIFAKDDYEHSRIVRGKVVGLVKGGLLVEIHRIRGFVPSSQLRLQVNTLDELMGEELPLKILEIDQTRNKLILSHRKALEDEKSALRAEIVAGLEEGRVIKGKIVRVVDFGAFVDVGGIDGLLPISEISWKRVVHPNEELRVGEEIEVKVFKIDRELNRISLSLKQLQEDPWGNIIEKLREGQKIKGRVTKLASFGAFIEIENGVEALLPTTEISDKPVKLEDVVSVGMEIEAIVKKLKPAERRISLTLRESYGDDSYNEGRSEGSNDGETSEGEDKPKKSRKKKEEQAEEASAEPENKE